MREIDAEAASVRPRPARDGGSARRQIELLEMAEELAEIGHWRVDLRDGSVIWSAQIYRIHGRDPAAYSPNLVKGIDAYHPDDRALVRAHIASAVRDRTGFDFQLRLVRPDGEVRLVRSRGRVECGADGEPCAIFGVFQDVTKSHERLLQDKRALEGFARAASHELQSPLRSMLGFAALIEDTLPDDVLDGGLREDAHLYLERVTAGSSRLTRLVEALRAYAGAVRTEVGLEEVDLDALVREIVARRAPAIREAGASVTVEPLPTVTGVRAQLTTCFEHLLDNALRYRVEGRAHTVRLSGSRAPNGWRLTVEDDGRGFESRLAERAFDLFARLERSSSDEADPPLGVGLSICRRVVQAHGGTVRAEGWPGLGAAFEITLPDRRPEGSRSDPPAGPPLGG